jgi:dipeptidyl-peptidase-4
MDPATRHYSRADYADAERFLPTRLLLAAKNAVVHPRWLGEADWFWYRRFGQDGYEFVLVDAASGAREAAFDHRAVAGALQALTGEEYDAGDLAVTDLAFAIDRSHVDVRVSGAVLRFDRVTGACDGRLERRIEKNVLLSPDSRLGVYCRDQNLFLIDPSSGESRALTTNGEHNYGFGVLSDASLVAIPVSEGRLSLPPINVVWSPDSCYLVIARVDERHLREYPFLRSVPLKGASPTPYTLRRALIGDRRQPVTHLVIIDVATGEQKEVAPAEPAGLEADCDALGDGTCWFDSRSSIMYLAQVRDQIKTLRLIAIDLKTANQSIVLEERFERYGLLNLAMYNVANVRIVDDGKEFVWFSERSGWGHLYLYGGDGSLKRPITSGEWVVFDIIDIDEKRRTIYFTGSNREKGVNPYLRFFYRASLDGGEPVLLTPELADHMIDGTPQPMVRWLYGREPSGRLVSPSGRFFVVTSSTLASAPVSVVRSTVDGAQIAEVERCSTAELDALGYVPPEAFVAKAADGVTDIHGVIYWPPDHEPIRKRPVIDALYNGFQVSVVPRNFITGHLTLNPYGALSLASLGFIVVTLDARGTAMRSRAFHDHSYRNFGDAGIDDHVAVLQELGERHRSFDMDRIGAAGYSFGGYYSTRALLTRPDFFKVAVSGAGCHNWQGMYPGYENLIGEPMYRDGGSVSPDGLEVPSNYVELDNATLASRLRGRLMLFIGDLDENVPAAVNFQFADALQREGKEFDLLVLWGATHSTSPLHPYAIRKSWDFFVRHLMEATPPDWNRST